MFVKDFNESFVGKKLLTETSKSLDKKFTSIEDFGINLEKNMYYFNQLSDSITYNCFLIPIKDAKRFESLIENKEKKFTQQGDIRTMVLPDSTSIIKWNNNMLYFVTGSIKGSFFADSVKSARYGIKDIRFQNNYDDVAIADSSVVVTDSTYTTTAEPMVEVVEAPVIEKAKVQKKPTVKKNTKKTVAAKKTGKKKKHQKI
ncbi:hypothetical protein [Pedobacter sp. P26]|uniref:hypothetical protein n=1 Tax=Pedobacter sp. P26 TaxID=3423956 RepID=UPI003D67DC39